MNTTSKGDTFEIRVHLLLQKLLQNDKLHVPGKRSKIFHKKGYYSKERGSNIVFDISIETYLPGASEYSLLTLIECKNYASSIPVNDVEEFSAKIEQIGQHNTKGIFIANNSFQKSALNIARSKKLAVVRINESSELEWILYRKERANNANCLSIDSPEFMHAFIAENEDEIFFSLQDLLLQLSIIDQWHADDDFVTVPHLKSTEIDALISQTGIDKCYNSYRLEMHRLCEVVSSIYDARTLPNKKAPHFQCEAS